MAQKLIKAQNNSHSDAYGKYFAQAVYDNHFIGTDELADFIQRQASMKKSYPKASFFGNYFHSIDFILIRIILFRIINSILSLSHMPKKRS